MSRWSRHCHLAVFRQQWTLLTCSMSLHIKQVENENRSFTSCLVRPHLFSADASWFRSLLRIRRSQEPKASVGHEAQDFASLSAHSEN